eukprot:CAMPEP_0174262564 /NCGR_PEP_ID=MMETSP0439-20130205/13729_1 /TAXON_ID=0 /ORGANISM="Stereomyxa ramosa, Strain Chinc5" /LENGTH=144 /DNA_ID=CAMNT_0015347331 /DNA_START=119 /DNA_END=553 /DNA_ORIENTATION=-
MVPAWQQLGEEYQDSSVVIADVDCTVHSDLCQRFEVRGYPTLKYWVNGEENDYQGGRDFDALNAFVQENLYNGCQVDDPTECSERELGFIAKMRELGSEAISKQQTRLNGMAGSKMKPDLKRWLNQRLSILNQLSEGDNAKDEL